MDAFDAGLLMIRVVIGPLMIAHGAQKLFGWFNGYGIAGTGGYFEALGYPRGNLMAVVAGVTEAGSGLGLAAGLLTPLAAAGLIGMTVNIAVAAHAPNGFWNHNARPGWEYPMVLGTIAAGLALTGPGRYALDNALDVPAGVGYGMAAIGVGLATGLAFLAIRQTPLEEEKKRTAEESAA